MKARQRIEAYEDVSVNLTPLIDVVFVILIMFIVVAPLLELDRVELAAGPSMEAETKVVVNESGPIAIHVYADNTIGYNGRAVTIPQLEAILRVAKARMPNERPQLFHDRNARFGTYQSIKNCVEVAGFTQMDVILKPQ